MPIEKAGSAPAAVPHRAWGLEGFGLKPSLLFLQLCPKSWLGDSGPAPGVDEIGASISSQRLGGWACAQTPFQAAACKVVASRKRSL